MDTFAPTREPLTKKTTPTAEILGAGLVLLACLLAMFHQTVFSAFDLTEGGGGSVLEILLLEHQWRWISGNAAHQDLWSPPFFFPQSHTAGDAEGAPWMHIFAMWAGIQAAVPTLNGSSGEFPPGWPLAEVAMASPADHERISTAIHDWMRRHPREIGNVCWITSDAPGAMLIENTETGGGAN